LIFFSQLSRRIIVGRALFFVEEMVKQNIYFGFYILLLCMVIVACVIPGQAAQPTLATDPNALSTFIAGTSQALATQTAQAAPLISPSLTPAAVPTETLVSTPEISLERTSLVTQSDGSIVFTDYKAGIAVTFPPIWMPFRVGEKEYYKAWESDFIKDNGSFTEFIAGLQTSNVAVSRLYAFDIRPGYVFNERFSSINVVYEGGDLRNLEEWLEAEKDKSQFADFELISTTFRDTPNGIHALMLEQKLGRSEGHPTYYREIFFSVPSGTVFIDCMSDFEFKDAVIADFDRVVDSIVFLKQ
jgi:hypothetical protein